MPALVAFGRRWQVGSDDFFIPGCIDVVVKFCWLVAAVTIYLQNDGNFLECASGKHLRIYMYGIFSNLILIIVVDLLALKTTMTSYIMDTKSRRFLTPCIYIRLVCEFVDVCWNLLGTIWVYGHTPLNCQEAPVAVAFIKRFIICNWFSLVILTLFILCLWDRFGGMTGILDDDYSKYWSNKWKKLTCLCNSGGVTDQQTIDEGFEEIGKIFSHICRDYDFVTTDVIAGFLSLYQKESTQLKNNMTDNYKKLVQSLEIENEHHHQIVTRQPASLPRMSRHNIYNLTPEELEHDPDTRSMNSEDSVQDIVLVNHYLNFVLGVLGWPMFLSNNYKNRAFRRLWKQLQCCSCFRSQEFTVTGDNACLCHTSALQETAQLSSSDLVYVSFQNKIYEPVFYVAVDHKTKAIVVSIRGTMSIIDLVADFTAMPKTINGGSEKKNVIPGLPSNFKAYHGVILCAMSVRKILTEKKILEELKSKYPDYNLVFIGMSLGAGTATLLGMMYLSQYPTLKVFAVSPPGGLLSLEAAKFTERFTLSIVYGDDMVPRLSLPSIYRLKNKIIQAIYTSRTPKFLVLIGGCELCCGTQKIKFSEEKQTDQNPPHPHPNKKIHQSNHQYPVGFAPKMDVPNPVMDRWKKLRDSSSMLAYPMFLPGRILHITERPNYADLQGGLRWHLRWADRTEFGDIVISPRMYKDHLHFRMEKSLQEFVCDGIYNGRRERNLEK